MKNDNAQISMLDGSTFEDQSDRYAFDAMTEEEVQEAASDLDAQPLTDEQLRALQAGLGYAGRYAH
jgi:hypothetical protein